MCVMSEKLCMQKVCEKGGYTCRIEFDVTPGRREKMNSGKSTYAYRRRNHSTEKLGILLCRINTNTTKEDMDLIINAF